MLIYCVEDDASIRELILCALKTGGYQGIGFESSFEFWNALDNSIPDLILLDIMLPLESGTEIIQKLKKSNHNEIPVIFITAKTSEYDRVKGLDLGADDYIIKPFGIMEMLSRIKAVLRRTKKTANILTDGDIQIDLEAREVTVNDTFLTLTHKEFELLHLLMKNIGKVINREQLLSQVWGYEFMGESRTLDVHIRTLRQKLSDANSLGTIKTVRNVGYKMERLVNNP